MFAKCPPALIYEFIMLGLFTHKKKASNSFQGEKRS
jgi:hypothetical protein